MYSVKLNKVLFMSRILVVYRLIFIFYFFIIIIIINIIINMIIHSF